MLRSLRRPTTQRWFGVHTLLAAPDGRAAIVAEVFEAILMFVGMFLAENY
jgi:hypothetical protein